MPAHAPHPASQLYGDLTAAEDAKLEASIRDARRLFSPIVLLEGQILDGNNRERICLKFGVEPSYVQYDGPTDLNSLLEYVRQKNEAANAGRQITKEHRELAAARAAKLRNGQKKSDNSTQALSIDKAALTTHEAAKIFDVSTSGLSRARRVVNNAVPELETAVRAGKVSMAAAAEVAAGYHHDKQRELLAAGPNAVTAAAVERRKKRETPQPCRFCGKYHSGDCPHVVPVAKWPKRGQAIVALSEELFEMARRPPHRYPYLQIAKKTEELRGACRRVFGSKLETAPCTDTTVPN